MKSDNLKFYRPVSTFHLHCLPTQVPFITVYQPKYPSSLFTNPSTLYHCLPTQVPFITVYQPKYPSSLFTNPSTLHHCLPTQVPFITVYQPKYPSSLFTNPSSLHESSMSMSHSALWTFCQEISCLESSYEYVVVVNIWFFICSIMNDIVSLVTSSSI